LILKILSSQTRRKICIRVIAFAITWRDGSVASVFIMHSLCTFQSLDEPCVTALRLHHEVPRVVSFVKYLCRKTSDDLTHVLRLTTNHEVV